MNHCLFVNTIHWMRRNYPFNLLGKSEGHKFWNPLLNACPKCTSKVNTKYFTIYSIDQEVFQMSVSYSQ